jgi:hypothetical protein
MIGGKSQDPETDSDFRLAPGSFTKLENLIFNHHTRIRSSFFIKPPAPEVFVPAFAAWPAALRRPAAPATLAQRPTLN